jgi:ribose transport system permease protein
MQMRNASLSERIRYTEILGISVILIALFAFFSLLSEQFFTVGNLFRILLNISTIGIMALGEALVIIICGIDLSVSSTFAIAGVITALSIVSWGTGVLVGIVLGTISGIIIGSINGMLIVRARLTPFIATFGMLSVIRGAAYAISGGYTIPVYLKAFTNIGMAYAGPVPVPVIVFIGLTLVCALLLARTSFGVSIFATGGNVTAAFFSGIRTSRVRFAAYVLSGGLAALAGIISTAKNGMGTSTAGLGYELDVITAVILGGVSLKGGRGNIFGVMIGAAIMGVIRNGLLILSISAYYQTTIIGAVVIAVASFDAIRSRR